MAHAAPPRRESLGSLGQAIRFSRRQTSLEKLLAMGFQRIRAEKAIAATGNKGVNFASEWLLSHVDDPRIDEGEPREFIVYLCPTGELLSHLVQFWQRSQTMGWNSAHIYHPHITLCSFFSMADDKVTVIDKVADMMTRVIQEWKAFDYSIGLDLDTKNNSFIGYFVSRPVHQLLEDLMIRVQQEFNSHGIEIKLLKRQLHMTLAFQYKMEHQDNLMDLARDITVPKNTTWEVRVYSRDPCLKTNEVRRIIKHYQPVQGDELELCVEDYIYMDPQEVEKSMDGWYKGSSHLTGAVGFFPGNFTEVCSQMDTWTLHRTVELKGQARHMSAPPSPSSSNSSNIPVEIKEEAEVVPASNGDYDSLWSDPAVDMYATVNKQNKRKPQRPSLQDILEPRKMFVVRHAQRCDFSYKNWFHRSFDDDGVYKRFDLNCPAVIWPRNSFKDYSKDSPITNIGESQAFLTGEGLKLAGESVAFIYASPSFRCIQTAHQIIKGITCSSDENIKICVEPGLFEWNGWCREGMPTFMTEQELARVGFPIDLAYVPYLRCGQLDHRESVEAYYTRSHQTTQHVIKRHSAQRGTILLVGHSASMDACTWQLRGKPPCKTDVELRDVVRGCPYCSLCSFLENPVTQSWDFCQPPIPPLSHGGIKEYDWTSLIT